MLLRILPVDGIYHEWQPGDTLKEVAERYRVTTESILDWSGNCLDRKRYEAGELNFEPGQLMVLPEGKRRFEDP